MVQFGVHNASKRLDYMRRKLHTLHTINMTGTSKRLTVCTHHRRHQSPKRTNTRNTHSHTHPHARTCTHTLTRSPIRSRYLARCLSCVRVADTQLEKLDFHQNCIWRFHAKKSLTSNGDFWSTYSLNGTKMGKRKKHHYTTNQRKVVNLEVLYA